MIETYNDAPDDQRAVLRPFLENTIRATPLPGLDADFTVEDVIGAGLARLGFETGAPTSGLKEEEHEALIRGNSSSSDFVCVPLSDERIARDGVTRRWFERVMLVKRLREVRVLTGFTRVLPLSPGDDRSARLAPLVKEEERFWLPAVEVIGEGIFLELRKERLQEWEQRTEVRDRAAKVNQSYRDRFAARDQQPDREITPRLLLVHSLAHALITQWALDCGYPAASLRERLYVSDDMAAVLIYTATSDSAGSLGGIVGLAENGDLDALITEAITRSVLVLIRPALHRNRIVGRRRAQQRRLPCVPTSPRGELRRDERPARPRTARRNARSSRVSGCSRNYWTSRRGAHAARQVPVGREERRRTRRLRKRCAPSSRTSGRASTRSAWPATTAKSGRRSTSCSSGPPASSASKSRAATSPAATASGSSATATARRTRRGKGRSSRSARPPAHSKDSSDANDVTRWTQSSATASSCPMWHAPCAARTSTRKSLPTRRRSAMACTTSSTGSPRSGVNGTAVQRGRDPRPLSRADRDEVVTLIRGDFDLIPSLPTRIGWATRELIRLTEQQSELLRRLEENPRVLIRGAAGTGKTVIAVEEASRAARAGARVLFLCFNRLLAASLQDTEPEGVTVSTLHALMSKLIRDAGLDSELPDADETDLYEQFFPVLTLEALSGPTAPAPFHMLVVDEGQDILLDNYLDVLDQLVVGGLRDGRWRMFYDPNQNIFQGIGAPAMERLLSFNPTRYPLTVNCRNTEQVAMATAMFSGCGSLESSVQGPKVETLWYRDRADQRRTATNCIRRLLSQGVPAREITILSTTTLRKSCLADGWPADVGARLADATAGAVQDDGAVRFSTVQAFKGLESDAVVLLDAVTADPSSRYLTYVGASRARTLLAILLDAAESDEIADRYAKFGEAAAELADPEAAPSSG